MGLTSTLEFLTKYRASVLNSVFLWINISEHEAKSFANPDQGV